MKVRFYNFGYIIFQKVLNFYSIVKPIQGNNANHLLLRCVKMREQNTLIYPGRYYTDYEVYLERRYIGLDPLSVTSSAKIVT